MSWCPQDHSLLLSSSKDNRTICWDVNSTDVICEMPTAEHYNFDVQWCPTVPGIFSTSSFDGKVGIASLLSCTQSEGVGTFNDDFTVTKAAAGEGQGARWGLCCKAACRAPWCPCIVRPGRMQCRVTNWIQDMDSLCCWTPHALVLAEWGNCSPTERVGELKHMLIIEVCNDCQSGCQWFPSLHFGVCAGDAKPLKKAPTWMMRPCGASFGFGGRLVSFANHKQQITDPATGQVRQVDSATISMTQVVTEQNLVTHSEAFETARKWEGWANTGHV